MNGQLQKSLWLSLHANSFYWPFKYSPYFCDVNNVFVSLALCLQTIAWTTTVVNQTRVSQTCDFREEIKKNFRKTYIDSIYLIKRREKHTLQVILQSALG